MRILIVEDNKILNGSLTAALEKESYAIDSFYDGTKALRHILVNHSNYDLMIFDNMLPGTTGIELCIALREKGIFTPILMLTGISDTPHKIRALDAGADDYMTKPFSIRELAARVRALLRRPREAITTELKLRGIAMSSSSKQVTYKNTELKLTLKEFGILEYLIRNCGQVISRDQLLDHVWDFEVNAFSNIVDVHITNLRKKLERVGAKHILETVRGTGFIIKS